MFLYFHEKGFTVYGMELGFGDLCGGSLSEKAF